MNQNSTSVDYVKNCVKARRFKKEDAKEVRNLIVRNFLEINSKDYDLSTMEKLTKVYDEEKVLNVASYAHMYVFEFEEKIVGTGSISSFWGSEIESILLCVFVLPEFHGKGIGRKIINTLEQDEFYVRANRIEIPASITATEFYRKFGYDYKDGVKELDDEHHYRLEKFKETELKYQYRIDSFIIARVKFFEEKEDVENNMCWILIDFWADRVYYKTVAYVTGLIYPMR